MPNNVWSAADVARYLRSLKGAEARTYSDPGDDSAEDEDEDEDEADDDEDEEEGEGEDSFIGDEADDEAEEYDAGQMMSDSDELQMLAESAARRRGRWLADLQGDELLATYQDAARTQQALRRTTRI